ncbi:MAG: hypothetical protein BWY19_00051 [bacterium ADurb.Bin212]|nr:MAG: hypothetical protein BWY19_00051 [bacterium ADurb.Bin212]
MNEIRKAYKISAEGLRSCYAAEGILAGKRNFVDFWARDSMFASLGSIALGDTSQVKTNLKLYLKHQKTSGHLPYRIISIDQFLKYLHIKKRFKKPLPNYKNYLGDKVVDQNILFPLSACELLKADYQKEYITELFPHLELSFLWLERQDKNKDGLIEEGYLANWMDHTKKKGQTLINNVLYYGALKQFVELNNQLGNCEVAARYQQNLEKTAMKIDELFWNEDYYIDWVDGRKHHYLDTAGNLLAIIFGLTDASKSKMILERIKQYQGKTFIPKANYPYYKKRIIQPQLFLAGLADYGGYRIWIGALCALAWHLTGDLTMAHRTLANIAKSINEFGAVYEIYTPYGHPIKRWPAYKNEVPFAWSCGLFVWATSKIYPESKEWILQ